MLVIDETKIDNLLKRFENIERQFEVRRVEVLYEEILTPKEAVRYLKVGIRHLDRLRETKKLGFVQDGKK